MKTSFCFMPRKLAEIALGDNYFLPPDAEIFYFSQKPPRGLRKL